MAKSNLNLVRARKDGTTKERALYEAKGLLQRYGFNGFSFQHIADVLGIKKPSLYDHFKSKDELGLKLVGDYYEAFLEWSAAIEDFLPDQKVGAFFENFHRYAENAFRVCPMSAFIGDFNSLSPGMKKAVNKLYLEQLDWLREVIQAGQKIKIFRRDRTCKELSNYVVSVAIGCQFSARVLGSPQSVKEMKAQTLQYLKDW